VFRILSRRRRLELLEPVLANAFRNTDAFVKRSTNLKIAIMAKYLEMSEVGPMCFAGRDGAEELYELFTWLRSLADQVVQRRSTAEWLLLVRRTFLAPFDANAMPPRWFVESFLRRSRRPTLNPRLIGRMLRASPSTLEDVHDLLMTTTAMWHVGQEFRTVSKGMVVTIIDPVTFFGVAVPTDRVVQRAIVLFESRRQRWHETRIGTPLSKPGVIGRRFAVKGGEHRSGGAVCGWYEDGVEKDRQRYFLRWRTHYFPEFIDPKSVFGLGTGQKPSSRSLAAAGAIWACWKNAGLQDVKYRMSRGTWNLWGVQVVEKEFLRSALRDWTQVAREYDPEWDPEAGFEELQRSSSELEWIDSEYSLACFFTDKSVLIDLFGASRALDEAHVRQSGGDSANQWTRLFEAQVQEVVDATSWRPNGEVRGLRGRTIRYQGQALTDIDAIAQRDDVLILIDAKAWAVPSALEFGEYWAVQARARIAEQAADAWQRKMEIVRQHPELLGLTGVSTIIGVVVAPEAPYVWEGSCTQEVGLGLLSVSSLAELDFCLRLSPG
jgi:hypothetical protein